MIIDANVTLGRFAASGAGFANPAGLKACLKRTGITKAVVHSAFAREADPGTGNRLLSKVIRPHPEMIPCWVLTTGPEPPERVIQQMKRNQAGLARVFPKRAHFSIAPWCFGGLAQALETEGIPLFVDFESTHWGTDPVDWPGLIELCRAFPRLAVILAGVSITGPRKYDRLLAELPNLHLETSQMISPDEISRLSGRGFGQRLIFGSGLPLRTIGGALGVLENSGLKAAELSAIASDNLLRLMGGSNMHFKLPMVGRDSLIPPFFCRSDGRTRLSVPTSLTLPNIKTAKQKYEIIDLHIHQGRMHPIPEGYGNADDIIRCMDRNGARKGMLTSLWSCYSEVKPGNRAVAEALRRFRGRLYGYLTLDPKYPEEIVQQLKEHGNNPVFRGIKAHCDLHGVELNNPGYAPILKFADQKSWAVLAHTGVAPETLKSLCARYPRANFIIAHGIAHKDDVAKLCRKHPNLFLDTATSKIEEGALERKVALAGADRIVYGSDYALFDFSYAVGCVVHSSLTTKEKALILGGNARRLLGM